MSSTPSADCCPEHLDSIPGFSVPHSGAEQRRDNDRGQGGIKFLHSCRWSVANGDASSLLDGPVLLRSLRDTGARNPRRDSTHSDRDPRSDSITILCGGWSDIESGEPGTGHSARWVPKRRPGKPRHCIDARSDGSPRSLPYHSTFPQGCDNSLPSSDTAKQGSASVIRFDLVRYRSHSNSQEPPEPPARGW